MAFQDSLQKMQQLPEGKRRFFMLVSMLAFSFFVLAVAWQSFERNLGLRLGDTAQETNETVPGPLQSLVEDVKRIAKGGEPLLPETSTMESGAKSGWIEQIFSTARAIRRIMLYNIGEIQKWLTEVPTWITEVLW